MPVPFPPILTVTALHDPVIDNVGFDPHDPFVSLTGTSVRFDPGEFLDRHRPTAAE